MTDPFMPISEADLRHIVEDVWRCTLGFPLSEAEAQDSGPGTGALAARVRITGPVELTLFLRCRREVARHWAGVMFQRTPAETTAEDAGDALSELANMVAGNVKGQLPGRFELSLPVVAEWRAPESPRNGRIVAATRLRCEGDSVDVFLLAADSVESAAP